MINMREVKNYCDRCKKEVSGVDLNILSVDFENNALSYHPKVDKAYYGKKKYDLCTKCMVEVYKKIRNLFPDYTGRDFEDE